MGAVLSLVCNHAPALNPTTSLPNRQLSLASVTSSSTGAGMEGGTLDISSVPNERVEGLAEEVALPSPVAADPRGTYSRLGHLYHLHPSDFIQQLLQNQGINLDSAISGISRSEFEQRLGPLTGAHVRENLSDFNVEMQPNGWNNQRGGSLHDVHEHGPRNRNHRGGHERDQDATWPQLHDRIADITRLRTIYPDLSTYELETLHALQSEISNTRSGQFLDLHDWEPIVAQGGARRDIPYPRVRLQPPDVATSSLLQNTSGPALTHSNRRRPNYPPRTSSLSTRQHGTSSRQRGTAVAPPQHVNSRSSSGSIQMNPPLNTTNNSRRSGHSRLNSPEEPTKENQSSVSPGLKDCIACLEPHSVDDFPPMTTAYTHLPSLCTPCVQEALAATALEIATINRLRCTHAGCPEIITHNDIRRLATPQVFERYDYLVTRVALGALENFMYCPNPRCNGGQENLGVLFVCIDCGNRFCTRHNVDWHEGETCLQYENRINVQSRAPERPSVQRGEDQETRELLARISKPCPKCKRPIQKNAGCDHMKCICGHQFCWLCFGSWPRGHMEGCPITSYAHLLR
ncbi:hypothetical protein V8E51_003902 [Hyaloscypha variabilis]